MSDLRTKLDEKIPRSEISQRDGGGGAKLDYVSGYYVIKRLNEVFGQGNWSYSVLRRELTFSGPVKRYSGDVHSVSYLADVELIATIDGRSVRFTDVGYGDGTDKTNPGKAHELAAKEAVTDGLKRCAKNLGMSLGLALYDKAQENVDEEEPKSETKAARAEIETPRSNNGSPKAKGVGADTTTTPPMQAATTGTAHSNGTITAPQAKPALKSALKVLVAQGKATVPDLKKKYSFTEYDSLKDEDIIKLYNNVKRDYPELKLV